MTIADTHPPRSRAHYTPGRSDLTMGRRLRAFCHAVKARHVPEDDQKLTMRELYAKYHGLPALMSLPISVHTTEHRDPELHYGLQDLGWMIGWDLAEAGACIDGTRHYAGIDDGIEPVSDDHVRAVIPMLQRELNRELRTNPKTGGPIRPGLPLASLPWQVQRAIVERRRLRYQQWGITPDSWAAGTWSVWEVPEDADWRPPWLGSA
jgi:hypothetical protein